ncbi:MAG: acyltransferase [Chloroflexi bacterium]|nr:acyltransferase [Chloroflexota bacterium]
MAFSTAPLIGRLCIRLAGAMRGPYKDRRVLANLTQNPYISPRAQIHCPRLTIGPHCFIDDDVTIYAHPDADDAAGGEVRLGEGVHIYRGTIIEIGRGGSVIIGDHTHIQSHCNIKGFLGSTRIGRHVQIAPHCGFSPYEHGFDDLGAEIREQKIVSSGDIVLEDNVWLGMHVQVLDGVTIGEGTVVGAGAVVTRSLPAYSVAVGVPARVIRRRGGGGEAIR